MLNPLLLEGAEPAFAGMGTRKPASLQELRRSRLGKLWLISLFDDLLRIDLKCVFPAKYREGTLSSDIRT